MDLKRLLHMDYVGEKDNYLNRDDSSCSPIVLVALNKVAAEKRMCPPEGTITEFLYQKD